MTILLVGTFTTLSHEICPFAHELAYHCDVFVFFPLHLAKVLSGASDKGNSALLVLMA